MKVENMLSSKGNKVANQFIVYGATVRVKPTKEAKGTLFQSYDSVIAFKDIVEGKVYLDEKYWNYSRTTGKYRNDFLSENTAETRKKIESGEYILTNLN